MLSNRHEESVTKR